MTQTDDVKIVFTRLVDQGRVARYEFVAGRTPAWC